MLLIGFYCNYYTITTINVPFRNIIDAIESGVRNISYGLIFYSVSFIHRNIQCTTDRVINHNIYLLLLNKIGLLSQTAFHLHFRRSFEVCALKLSVNWHA